MNMGSRERTFWAFLLGVSLTAVTFLLARGSTPRSQEIQEPSNKRRDKEQAMLQASERLRAQDWKGAEDLYAKAVQHDPEDWTTWDGRALARMGIGNFAGALEDFSQAISLNNTTANLHDHHGVAMAKLCRFQEAVADFSRALDLSPGVGGYHFHRAQALEHCGDLGAARSDYQKAVEMIPPSDFMRQVAIQKLGALQTRTISRYY